MITSPYSSTVVFHNVAAMPMPGEHLDCFVAWSTTKEVCAQFKPQQYYGGIGLFFGEEGLTYDDLTPQIIWRGTDFPYLNLQNNLDQPTYEHYIEPNLQPGTADPLAAVIAILREKYSQLVPRWQGVVLTAEAEQEGRQTNSLPKVNIKFSSAKGKGKPLAVGNPKYKKWEDVGFPLADYGMPPEEMAKFKYHIDIGGGGGTTWTVSHSAFYLIVLSSFCSNTHNTLRFRVQLVSLQCRDCSFITLLPQRITYMIIYFRSCTTCQ